PRLPRRSRTSARGVDRAPLAGPRARRGLLEDPAALRATFARPSDAVVFAVAARGSSVSRFALDIGEVGLAGDVTLDRTERLLAGAGAGEILCTEPVAALLDRDLD